MPDPDLNPRSVAAHGHAEAAGVPALRLTPVSGPPVPAIVLSPAAVTAIGRSTACEVVLNDPVISRRHATIAHRGGWMIQDLGSKHGTHLNAVRLDPGTPVPLNDGDVIAIGPWSFRVGDAPAGPPMMATTNDLGSGAPRVEAVPLAEAPSLAQQRLALLMECATATHAATDEASLAGGVLDAAIAGSGYSRAAILRPRGEGEQVEVIAQRGAGAGAIPISRTLLSAAAGGRAVRLVDRPDLRHAQSVVDLGIEAAMCVPVQVGGSVARFLYLDAGPGVGRLHPEAGVFCTAVARLCGMAIGNIERRELERRQMRLEADLRAARETQQRLMPPAQGTVGPVGYAVRSTPGRLVAGDLFDVVRLGPSRTAVLLGDVAGKGIGAAMLMATAQTELRAALREHDDAGRAMTAANHYLATHSAPHEFVTLWVGIFDGERGTLSFADAGHGYWLHAGPGETPRFERREGGIIAGIDVDHEYASTEVPLSPGDRVVVFSDGVVEQASPDGEQFGIERTIAAVKPGAAPAEDVAAIFAAVIAFARTEALGDDVTVASVRFGGVGG